jgi:hypothetical protein
MHKEFRNLYSTQNINRTIESKLTIQEEKVAHMSKMI